MKYLWFIAVLLAVTGCQPEPDEYKLYDELVVETSYDENTDFSQYQTFVMQDEQIGFYSNQTNDTTLSKDESDLVMPIITRMKANLTQRGFTQVSEEEDPDVALNVLIVNNLNLFQQVVDPGYYNYYYGYSSYYYYPYVETYIDNTASLLVEMIDLKNRNSNNQVKVVWVATLGDLVSTVNRIKQTEEGIDQAFNQSPYIQ
jgi:hypothetical protein